MTIAGATLELSIFQGGMMSVLPRRSHVKKAEKLKRLFESPPVKRSDTAKRDLPAWSPALYSQGERRANKNVQAITALVYDYDSTTTAPETIIGTLSQRGLRFAVYTTWSHTPQKPRYRVVLFLSRSLSPFEYERAWPRGLSFIGLSDGVDEQAKDISRNYILPVRRDGFPYVGVFHDGETVNTDGLLQEEPTLNLQTPIKLDESSSSTTVEEILGRGAGKYKCACPFQSDSSAGSAFLRVTKDGRAFLQCTSSRHAHAESQYWLRKDDGSEGGRKGKRSGPRSVAARADLLAEAPERLLEYVEKKIAYSAPQGIFYRYQDGAWQLGSPLQSRSLQDHLIGLLPAGCDATHARALIDHVLSRQIYGFDCDSSAGPWIENPVRMLNLYAKPEIKPNPGSFDRIDALVDVLTAGDAQGKEWLTHWTAALIQNPERRSMVAVLCMSPYQGIGKSLYGRILSRMIGPGNTAVVSNRALRDRFNASYVTNLLVLADEVGMDSKSNDVLSELKSYITDEEVHCAAPYAQRIKVQNRMTWWMTSNARRPLVVDTQDRRVTVLAVPKPTPEHKRMLRGCFNSKTATFNDSFAREIEAYCDHLNQVQIDWRLISFPFQTEARRQIQMASQTSVEKFVEMVYDQGAVGIISDFPPPPEYFRLSDGALSKAVPCETLYGSYVEWCSRTGRRACRPEAELRLTITLLGNVKLRGASVGGRHVELYLGLPGEKRNPQGKVIELPAT